MNGASRPGFPSSTGIRILRRKNDFAAIYGDNAVKVEQSLEMQEEQEEEQELAPAA